MCVKAVEENEDDKVVNVIINYFSGRAYALYDNGYNIIDNDPVMKPAINNDCDDDDDDDDDDYDADDDGNGDGDGDDDNDDDDDYTYV
ncbi:hypothetical protein HZH66_008715 [Vespula vulgaris]|uniref:Uncharacterized protein n=1 Tax=Vespula vulgaris TaxID=7454 RepID=A0A834N1F1_VESVU|nr:hypothetical protein HZH66_008715 [Vespula vulgaris]